MNLHDFLVACELLYVQEVVNPFHIETYYIEWAATSWTDSNAFFSVGNNKKNKVI